MGLAEHLEPRLLLSACSVLATWLDGVRQQLHPGRTLSKQVRAMVKRPGLRKLATAETASSGWT